MKSLGWILLLCAVVLAAAVVTMATTESTRTAEQELAELQEGLHLGRLDVEEALTDLDHLVQRTANSGDPAFSARIRLIRGRMLLGIAAWDRARDDLQSALTLAALTPAERREIEDHLIDLHVRARDFDQGLDRVKALLERDPGDGSAWARTGELYMAKADLVLKRARDEIASRLIADDAEEARLLLDRLGTLDPADAARADIGHDLAALFEVGEEARAQRILRFSDEAARENAQARFALATSLSDPGDPAAPMRGLANLLRLLQRAGRLEDVTELGTSALRSAKARGDTESIELLSDVLAQLGRLPYACDLSRWLLDRGTPVEPERLVAMCGLFHRAGRWDDLALATGRLLQVGNASEIAKASVYSGLVQVRRGDYSGGRLTLQRFVFGNEPEPFPGARAEAWRRIAEACQRLHFVDEERDALENAVRLDEENSGPSLLRLATLASLAAHGGFRVPEERWAKAMALMPERTEELYPRWKRLGDLELKSAGITARGVLREQGWARIRGGATTASIYQTYVLAAAQLEAGDAAGAEPNVRRLLHQVPGFLPAIDLAILVFRKLGRQSEVVDLLLKRMRAAGADERSRAILAKSAPPELPPLRRLDFMTSDPEGFGRREIARGLAAGGRPDLALELVGEGEGANALPQAREVAARAHLAMGDAEGAFRALEPLGRRATSTAAGFDLYARACALSGHKEELLRATTRASRSLIPQRGRWLSLCDGMLQRGAAQAAKPLIERMDRDPRLRGGDVLVRLAWTQLLLGERAALALTAERSAAFDTGGSIELVLVLACSHSPAWSGLPAAAAALRRSAWKPTRLQRVALMALEGQTKPVRDAIRTSLAEDRADPLWVLARAISNLETGTERKPPRDPAAVPASDPKVDPGPNPSLDPLLDHLGPEAEEETARFVLSDPPRDPRWFWCILLSLETPLTAGWAQSAIDRLFPSGTDPESRVWPDWIAARLARSRGDIAEERRILEKLVVRSARFGPAWRRLEEIALALKTPPAALEDLRERRLHALGERAGTRAEIALEIARIQRRDGDLDGALASLAQVRELDPKLGGVQIEFGRVRAARGEWAEAVAALVRATRSGGTLGDSPEVGELLRALAAAGAGEAAAIPAEERWGELEALANRYPRDPRIPVALARVELERDPRNPTAAVRRAHGHLDGFLAAHEDVPLERLCAGTAEIWTDFYLRFDPARGRRILERQRLMEPSALPPWIQLGRLRAALGDPGQAPEAGDELEAARRMAPVPHVLREWAKVRLDGAPTLKEVTALTRDILKAEEQASPDPDLALEIAEALFGLGPEGIQPALRLVTQIAWTPGLPTELSERAALLRALALVARGRNDDAGRVRRILSELDGRLGDPYLETLALACTGLAGRPTTATAVGGP